MVGAVGETASMKRHKLWKTGEDGLCCSSSAIQTRLDPPSLLEERSETPIVFCCFFCVVGYPPNWGKRPRYIDRIDFIFCIFLKIRRVELSFQCRNEFCMPKYPNNCIFMGLAEKSGFSPNFCPYYSMAIWRLWAKKLINTILAEFGVFPSKNHDSIVFMQFC